jgi:hypothetical protein
MRISSCCLVIVLSVGFAKGQQYESPAPPPTAEPLVDSRLAILTGVFVPGRTVEFGGQTYTLPDVCRFTFTLPPGQKALGWRQRGEPLFDRIRNTCEAAFETGVPARFVRSPKDAVQPRSGVTSPENGYTWSSGYFRMWWTDPIGLTVTWATAGINWGWQGVLFCADYLGGSYDDWGFSGTLWSKVGQWDVGSDITCNDVGYKGHSIWTNFVFPPCSPTNPMFIAYDPVRAFGQNNGYLYGQGTTYNWGGACRFLLTPDSELVRTWN